MNKKILAGILALTLTLSGTVTAFAQNSVSDTGNSKTQSAVYTSGNYNYTVFNGQAVITDYNGDDEEITIPGTLGPDSAKVVSIGEGAFQSNEKIKKVTIQPGISLSANAFKNCKNLETVEIKAPDETSTVSFSIPENAFDGCTALKKVVIPKGYETIKSNAFYGCTSLETITSNADSNAKKIDFSATNLKTIEKTAFQGCVKISAVNFPSALEKVGEKAFIGCTALKSVTVPDQIKSIGNFAFGYETEKQKVSGFQILSGEGTIGENYAYANGFKTGVDLKTAKVEIKGVNDRYEYTGKAIVPNFSIICNGKTLAKNTDYTAAITKNTDSGKACITIKGTGKYYGTLTKTFIIIPKMTEAKLKAHSSTVVRLKWNKAGGALGYRVYSYDVSKKKWVKIMAITNPNTTECRITGLTPSTNYSYKVKAYGHGGYECKSPATTRVITHPSKCVITGIKSYGYRSVTARWKQASKGSSGFQYQITSNPSLKGGRFVSFGTGVTRYTITGRPIVSKKTYYVRVRAYKTFNGVKHFGAWSEAKKIVSK